MMDRALYESDLRAAVAGAEDWLRGQRILVTGATGMIGSCLADALLLLNAERGAGVEVYAAGRSREGIERRFGDAVNDGHFHYVPYDSTLPLKFDEDVDLVVHAATSAHPMAYSTDPVGIMKANLVGTLELLEYLRRHGGARLLFLSTGEIYGENPELPTGFREEDHGWVDSMRPRACYPESKRAAETLCASYVAQYGVDARVARLGHVYGPTLTASNSRADAQFLRNALNGEDIVMKSDGSQVRSWTYAADAVNALLWLLMRGETGRAYNVANPDATASIREYARTLADIGGVSLRFDLPSDVERAGYTRVTRAVLDPARLMALGWRAQYDLKTGLEHTYRILK
ncbi:MAG: NAD-dependent epimerase/dehydratase family protein [Clostridia bacterium]|nr:NAD-dependent epimerase/dehydratase family protein [Clostridia bacterium]